MSAHPVLLPLRSSPALTHVDAAIFTLRYFGACMQCRFCHDRCCQHGCDVNLAERDRILAAAEALRPFVAVPPERWFTTDIETDPEVPTGRYVRARTEGGACVFRNRAGRGCGLHAYAEATGGDYHAIKPMVCWTFPITWDQRVLMPSDDVRDDLVCAGEGMTLYEAGREELRRAFGDALVAELDLLAAQPPASAARSLHAPRAGEAFGPTNTSEV